MGLELYVYFLRASRKELSPDNTLILVLWELKQRNQMSPAMPAYDSQKLWDDKWVLF